MTERTDWPPMVIWIWRLPSLLRHLIPKHFKRAVAWIDAAPNARNWSGSEDSDWSKLPIQKLRYLTEKNGAEVFAAPLYEVRARERYLSEVYRLFLSVTSLFLPTAFVIFVSLGHERKDPGVLGVTHASDWIPWVIVLITLTLLRWDFHMLRIPEFVLWAPKEYIDMIKSRMTYAFVVIVAFLALLANKTVQEFLLKSMEYPLDIRPVGNSLAPLVSLMGFTAIIALRETGGSDRQAAVAYDRALEKFASDETYYHRESPRRRRRPRRWALVNFGLSTLLFIVVLKAGNAPPPPKPLPEDRLHSLLSQLADSVIIISAVLFTLASISPQRLARPALNFLDGLTWRKIWAPLTIFTWLVVIPFLLIRLVPS